MQRPFLVAWGIGIGFDNLYQMWEVLRDFLMVRNENINLSHTKKESGPGLTSASPKQKCWACLLSGSRPCRRRPRS